MALELPPPVAAQLRESIKRYVAEHLDQDIGDLKATMLLDVARRRRMSTGSGNTSCFMASGIRARWERRR